MLRFSQVDVFTQVLTQGNPVAVVHDAEGVEDAAMAAFARWTNLSETTFLLPPRDAAADYRLRIFTPDGELPFAGHPTLGSARAWLEAGHTPRTGTHLVQECEVGLVPVRRQGSVLAFAAPPLRREGPVDDALAERVCRALRVSAGDVEGIRWIDNGPGWIGVLLADAREVLALEPDFAVLEGLAVGVTGPYTASVDPASPHFETRAFGPGLGIPEDPVTGSLAAGLAQWLTGTGVAPDVHTVRQGTRLGRRGIIQVRREDGGVWIGGETTVGITGTVALGAPGAPGAN